MSLAGRAALPCLVLAGVAPGCGHDWDQYRHGGAAAGGVVQGGAGGAGGSGGAGAEAGSGGGDEGGAGGAGGATGCELSFGATWAKSYGGVKTQSVAAVAFQGGQAVLTGEFEGSISLGQGHTAAGGRDLFLAMLANDGTLAWSRAWGDAADQWGADVAIDGGNDIVITGSFQGSMNLGGTGLLSPATDVFVAKFGTDGAHQWSFASGGGAGTSHSHATSLALGSGVVVVAGTFSGVPNMGGNDLVCLDSGQSSGFVAAYDGAGEHLWSRALCSGVGSSAQVNDVAVVTDTGDVYLAGQYQGSIDIGGTVHTIAGGGDDLFIAKYDSGGEYQWSRGVGGVGSQVATCVGLAAGNVVIGGHFQHSLELVPGEPLVSSDPQDHDAFVAKLDGAGNTVWDRAAGGLLHQRVRALDVASSGNILVTGEFAGEIDFGLGPLASAGGDDVFLAKYAASGSIGACSTFGDTADQRGRGVAAADFAPTLVGDFGGSVDFGSGPVTSGEPLDVFVARFGSVQIKE